MKRVLLILVFFIVTASVSADGTETLGPGPDTPFGSGIVAAGVGGNGVITIDVPSDAAVRQTYLYWSGGSPVPSLGDNFIRVNGLLIKGDLIGGPAYFYGNMQFMSYRADITKWAQVNPGHNEIAISDMFFSYRENNGAGIIAIFDDGSDAVMRVRDGLDLAFVNFPEPRDTTVAQVFEFPGMNLHRTGTMILFVGSVGQERPNIVRVTANGLNTDYINALSSNNGSQWDTLVLPVDIPARTSEIGVQILSEGEGGLPASLAWVMAALSVSVPSDCINFSVVPPGTPVEGLGTIDPLVNIQTSNGKSIVLAEGVEPFVYRAPNDLQTGLINGGIESFGGFADPTKVHDYVFTFAPGIVVKRFSMRMLDYGDLNTAFATKHEVSLVAYSGTEEVTRQTLAFTSDGTITPESGSAGNLVFTGDAIGALEGEPGNYVFSIEGNGISRLETEYNSDVRPGMPTDPNMALTILCYEVDNVTRERQ